MHTASAPYPERIHSAHARGHLFAHMFEENIETQGLQGNPGNLVKVMAQLPQSEYSNGYGHRIISSDHGAMGIAATALHANHPVRVFTDSSHIGLLMDTAKPVHVCSGDASSVVKGQKLTFSPVEAHPPLKALQGLAETKSGSNPQEIDMLHEPEKRFAMAESALQEMWDYISTAGWKEYTDYGPADLMGYGPLNPGMNEVNLCARTSDICGIIVAKNGRVFGPQVSYADTVRAAVKLKEDLIAQFPDHFDATLPIVSYEIARPQGLANAEQPVLTQLSEEAIHTILNAPPQPQRHFGR